jgi:hypothetical protein
MIPLIYNYGPDTFFEDYDYLLRNCRLNGSEQAKYFYFTTINFMKHHFMKTPVLKLESMKTIHEYLTSGELELFTQQVKAFGVCSFFEKYANWLCEDGFSASEQSDLVCKATTTYFMTTT